MAHLSISHGIPMKNPNKSRPRPQCCVPGSRLLRGTDRSLQDLGREFGRFLGRFRQGDDAKWLVPLSKWVITPVINGISRINPLITGVITCYNPLTKWDEPPSGAQNQPPFGAEFPQDFLSSLLDVAGKFQDFCRLFWVSKMQASWNFSSMGS